MRDTTQGIPERGFVAVVVVIREANLWKSAENPCHASIYRVDNYVDNLWKAVENPGGYPQTHVENPFSAAAKKRPPSVRSDPVERRALSGGGSSFRHRFGQTARNPPFFVDSMSNSVERRWRTNVRQNRDKNGMIFSFLCDTIDSRGCKTGEKGVYW